MKSLLWLIAAGVLARLNAGPEALIEWTRAIDELKRGPMVLAVGRFSDPVGDDALDSLSLDKGEVDALRRCRASSCDFKLAESEITQLQDALRAAGANWRGAAQREFRQILIAGVRLHGDRGLLALPPYADHGGRMSVGEVGADRASGADRQYPVVRQSLHRRCLSVTAVVCDAFTSCYLAYLSRTRVDLFGGLFGGLKRAVIEGRIASDGPALMRDVRRRLESGMPGAEGGES